MRNGPEGGNIADVKTVGFVALSTDPLALDAWTFQLLGQPARDLPEYLRIAERMGLGRLDFRSLDPVQVQGGWPHALVRYLDAITRSPARDSVELSLDRSTMGMGVWSATESV